MTYAKTVVDYENIGINGYLITLRHPGSTAPTPDILIGTASWSEAMEAADTYIRKHKTSVQVSRELQEQLDCM